MIAICPQCELRLVRRRGSNCCAPCQAANHALYRYWARIGTPLLWADKRSRPRLLVLYKPAEAA